MEAWSRLTADKPGCTRTTNLVASLMNLGVAVRTHRTLDDLSGKSDTTFLLQPSLAVRGGQVPTKALLKAFEDGDLESIDPTHPFLDSMRGLHNGHALLDWMKQGVHQRLAYTAKGTRTVYVQGSPDPISRDTELASTKDIAVAAALGVLGCAIVRIEGIDNHRKFIVRRYGMPLRIRPRTNAATHNYDAVDLISRLRDGTLIKADADHPFLYAYYARKQRENILQHLDREVQLIMIRQPGTTRSAMIREDADDEAWEQAERHMVG